MEISTPQKRILITAFDFPPQTGGVSTYSWEFAKSLSDLGYAVTVVTKKRKGMVSNSSFKIIPLSLPSSGILSVPLFTLKLCSIIKNTNPDHIFCTLWMPGAASIYGALRILKKQIPYSIIIHGMEIIESKENWKKRLRSSLSFLKKKIFSQAQCCICISRYTQEKLIQQKICSPKKTIVVNNGVNPKVFSSEISKPLNSQTSLLTVARLVPHKGIDQVLFALPRIVREIPNLMYSIVGAGPDRERLESIVDQLVLAKHVEFLGQVPDSDLPQLYSKADLFVLLSREDKHNVEGFGLVFLEAAACRTPSLGGKSGGIPDAILHEQTGWLVSPTDQQEIAPALLNILKQPELIKNVGDAAYDHTMKNRTWGKVTEKILIASGVTDE